MEKNYSCCRLKLFIFEYLYHISKTAKYKGVYEKYFPPKAFLSV